MIDWRGYRVPCVRTLDLAVDGHPWNTTFGDMVMDMTFSPDGRHLAALGKQDGKWTVLVDDKAWVRRYDM